MVMRRFRLTFFDGKGTCETIRYLFHMRDVAFDDVRLSYDEFKAKRASGVRFLHSNFNDYIEKMSVGELGPANLNHLPLLDVWDVDGNYFRVGQTAAIERLVANYFHLLGDSMVYH
jgi:hypothetical protein